MNSENNRSGYSLKQLNHKIINCHKCSRLVEFREKIAREKRKQYSDWDYWGKPVSGYGDPSARIFIVGLAPAAHGGNRTGRVFTGDKSAKFLMRCLFDAGLTNQPTSLSGDDGLILYDAYMSPVLRCVPPGDKPTGEELNNCFQYFQSELALLTQVKTILALGGVAFKTLLKLFKLTHNIKLKDYPFGHGLEYQLDPYTLIGSYHPSPRNVNTKRLTKNMLDDLLYSLIPR